MATIRRLEDKDVRAIFECLHEGKPPPPRLSFQIVPVGPNGLKLSPPSYEFPDGLYVLLRPRSKTKSADQPRAPPHMQHLVWKDSQIPPETCPWSLSGPQFPQPTAIQQRYCYPKGRPEYSNGKGGALWTMYNTNGKEDTEYRLLHVYYSAKRAVNKGFKPGRPVHQPLQALASPPKRPRQEFLASSLASPPSVLSSPSSQQLIGSPGSAAAARDSRHRPLFAPRGSLSSEEECPSPPLCLEAFFPPSPGAVHRRPSLESSNFISPVNDHFFQRGRPVGAAPPAAAMPVITHRSRRGGAQAVPGPFPYNPLTPSPFRAAGAGGGTLAFGAGPLAHSPIRRPSPRGSDAEEEDDTDSTARRRTRLEEAEDDPFACDMSASLHEMDSAAWQQDSVLGGGGGAGSLLGLDLTPIRDRDPTATGADADADDGGGGGTFGAARSLVTRLDSFHTRARDAILSAPAPEQASLTNAYASWARHVARDPLGGGGSSGSGGLRGDREGHGEGEDEDAAGGRATPFDVGESAVV